VNRIAAALALVAVVGGCSTARSAAPVTAGAPAVRLDAALTSPTDVALHWTGPESGAAGWAVEYATDPHGPFTVLQFVPPGQTTYRHPNLMPETAFFYRVRPFLGPASHQVEVVLPDGLPDDNGDRAWAAPTTVAGATAAGRSVRDPASTAAAAPTDLRATVMDATGVRFTWTDHANDEEGFLLEVRPDGGTDFGVAAVLDPDVNSFGYITLPTEKRAAYRVRAFYYGTASNVAQQRTGAAP
jgi:hypothetical protein